MKSFCLFGPGAENALAHITGFLADKKICTVRVGDSLDLGSPDGELCGLLAAQDFDFCAVLGNIPTLPALLCADDIDTLASLWRDGVFAVCGSAGLGVFKGCPVFSPDGDLDNLAAYIERAVFSALPLSNCGACGGDCASMCAAIVCGRAARRDCVAAQPSVFDGPLGREYVTDGVFVRRCL